MRYSELNKRDGTWFAKHYRNNVQFHIETRSDLLIWVHIISIIGIAFLGGIALLTLG